MNRRFLFFAAASFLLALVLFNLPKKKEVHVPPPQVISVEEVVPVPVVEKVEEEPLQSTSSDAALPKEVNRMALLFQPASPLPIVETITYSPRVEWVEGRPAYVGDYASHFKTNKHFISRCLHGAGNYMNCNVSHGQRFNVFAGDKKVEFHLVLDLSRTKMWVYYVDLEKEERVLLKSYPVAVGRLNPNRPSGSLTPIGTFKLSESVAVYPEGKMGLYRGERHELIQIFGTRWIPFERGSCKGIGIHGTPWKPHPDTGEKVEMRECVGKYVSNGCIRLLTEDMEELFSVIISKDSYVHIVKDFQDASLPGKSVEI